MADQEHSYRGHRDACDECHQRKVRCVAGSGACTDCISLGKTCTYSPKVVVGRPRKRKAGAASSKPKVDNKPTPIIAPQSFSGFANTNLRMDSSAHPKPLMHSDPPSSYSCADVTMWNMEPDLVNSSGFSLSSMGNPFSMQNQAVCPQSFAIHNKDLETEPLFIDYDNNCGVMLENQFSSTAADEGVMGFPKEQAKDACLVAQTLHTDAHPKKTSLGAQQSIPRLSQECHDSLVPPPYQNRVLKGQGQVMAIRWSAPSIISLTFYSLLNTVFDVRTRRDCLIALISSYCNDSNYSSPADLGTILQPISLFSRLVEPYLTSLESKISTLAVDCKPSPSLQCEQTTFHLLVATSGFILDILRIVSENHRIFVPEASENGSVNQLCILNSGTSSADPTSSPSSIHLTSQDLSQRLALIIHFTTIDYYALRWQRSLIQITNLLGDGSDDEAYPKELTDASACTDALRHDLTAAIDILRTPGNEN